MARIPFAPVPVRISVNQKEQIRFWWSHIVPYFDPDRSFFGYWGADIGDLRFLWKYLNSGMVFIDIGAHHGLYTIVAAKRLGRDGMVICFEPSKKEYHRLRVNLLLNRMLSVRTHPLALSESSGPRHFFQIISGDNTRGGLRAPDSEDKVEDILVETITLDDYISKFSIQRLDFIKIDVEGGELDLLRGATTVLTKVRPVFMCELYDPATNAWGYNARDIARVFESHSFKWFECSSDGSIVPHQILAQYRQVRNYLAVPVEKCETITDY